MSISENEPRRIRILSRFAVVGFGVSLAIAAACRPPEACVRFSDCDDGLTCADGRCVVPGNSPDVVPEEAGAADASVDADASFEVDADAELPDAPADGSMDADASPDAELPDAPADG